MVLVGTEQEEMRKLVQELSTLLSERQWRMAAAESCTGGWLSKVCTEQAGSSAWFESAVVSYSNQAKRSLLAVPAEVLSRFGAVSKETALAMAQGVLQALPAADLGLAVSGIAGPTGGSPEKPIGTVCFAVCCPTEGLEEAHCMRFTGDRESIRRSSVSYAVRLAIAAIHT